FRLYAFIVSPDIKQDSDALLSVARQFSYAIEMLDDGILFDVSGLEKLIGNSDRIAQQILEQLQKQDISGNIAVANTVDSAMLLARQNLGLNHAIVSPSEFQKLPLQNLGIENDSIGIFNELGINNIEDLRQVPVDDLINRYGPQFPKVIDVVRENGKRFLNQNVKEINCAWSYEVD